MPYLSFAQDFGRGINRCTRFLSKRDPAAAVRAREVIDRAIRRLTINPKVGRPCPSDPKLRELVIPFGKWGYTALYRHDPERDAVILLAFRHQREAGYGD